MKKGMTRHLWKCEVRHRDYLATVNGDQLVMTSTTLILEVAQPEFQKADFGRGLAAAKRFLSRHKRKFALSSIRGLWYQGDIDN